MPPTLKGLNMSEKQLYELAIDNAKQLLEFSIERFGICSTHYSVGFAEFPEQTNYLAFINVCDSTTSKSIATVFATYNEQTAGYTDLQIVKH